MDIIAYKDKTNCPVRPEDLALLQEMTAMVADALAGSTSANVIMRGCEVQGNTITAGILCVNGELIFANAGLKNTTGLTRYLITETVSDAISNEQLYSGWTKIRRAQIDNINGTFVWDSAARYSVIGVYDIKTNINTSVENVNYSVVCRKKNDRIDIQGGYYIPAGSTIQAGTTLFNVGFSAFYKEIRCIRTFSVYDSASNNVFRLHLKDNGDVETSDVIVLSSSRFFNFNSSFVF